MESNKEDVLPEIQLKLVLAGESGVGKTNIIARFTRNKFLDESVSTIGVEFATRTIRLQSPLDRRVWLQVKLQIWDTAGQERYRAVSRTYYRGAVGCILVFSSNSKRSFKHLDHWIEEVRKNGANDPVVLLVGNKCDLQPAKISNEQAEAFMKSNRCCCYMPVSAKTGENVDKAILALVAEILSNKTEIVEEAMKKREEKKQQRDQLSERDDRRPSTSTFQLSNDVVKSQKKTKSCC